MNYDMPLNVPRQTAYGELDYLADPSSARPYYAPPVYSPMQNPAHVDNMFGYLANMYGPALVEGFAGPDAFLAHQMPGQALADQYSAAQYQRSAARSLYSANRQGSSSVAGKLLGVQSVVNGGQPITQLDREHAQVGANVINNPIFKGFASQMIGPENLEGVLFGRRGDPAALASAASRVGFFRADAATGASKMGGESLEQFSSELYRNLYGHDANLDQMHGFGAGQTGEMMEHLFQQGRLPQSLGALNPAERVKAIGSMKRDDVTMTRLAEEFGHRDLMARDFDYSNATEEEQKLMLSSKVGDYKDRLGKTFKEIDKFRSGDPRSKSAEEIEQLDGFGLAANSVDAGRTANVLKEYNGAVAAIRELFGDNGRTNAPMGELLASLQHLTNGAQTQMSAGNVERMVRGVRQAARDTNVDHNELTQLIERDKSFGVQLGLHEATVEGGVAGRMYHEQSMRDAGAFEKAGAGKLNSKQAAEFASQMAMRGDASAVGNSLAALNRAVTEAPDQFKNTPAEAAAKAYREGKSTFVDPTTGQTVNLGQIAGEQGVGGVMDILRQSGASANQIEAYVTDRAGNQQYMQENYVFRHAQGHDLVKRISHAQGHQFRDRLNADTIQGTKPRGMSEEDFGKRNAQLAQTFSRKFTDMIMQETADMSPTQRTEHLEKRGREELTSFFKSSAGGSLGDREAARQADTYFNAMFGDTKEARQGELSAAYARLNVESVKMGGQTIAAQSQVRDRDAVAMGQAREDASNRRIDRIKAMSAGTESTFAQRFGEELDNLGAGNSGTVAEALSRLFNVQSKDEMLQRAAPELQGGLVAAARMNTSAVTTPQQIQTLIDETAKDPNGASAKKLKVLAGYKANEKLTEEQQGELGARAMQRSAYQPAGATDAERAANQRKLDRSNTLFKAYNTGKAEDAQAAARAYAQETLGERARDTDINQFAEALLSGDSKRIGGHMRGGLFRGFTDEQRREALNVSDALRVSQEFGGLGSLELDQSAETIAAAADRPTAQRNVAKRAAAVDVQENLRGRTKAGTFFSTAYDKLRQPDMGAEEFARRKNDLVRDLGSSMAGVVIDEMGMGATMTPEKRAEFMEKRTKEELAKHFSRVNPHLTEKRREELAGEHFEAMFGKDQKKKVQGLNDIYEQTVKRAQEHGFNAREMRPLDMPVTELLSNQEYYKPLPMTGNNEYYKQLGVTETMSKEQQTLFDDVVSDASGKKASAAMRDSKKRELLLTMPDAAGVQLFERMSPEARNSAMQTMQSPMALAMLSGKERANVKRLQSAIMTNEQNKLMPEAGGGMPPMMFQPGQYPGGPLVYGAQQQTFGFFGQPSGPSPLAQKITADAGSDIYAFLENKSRDPAYAKLRGNLSANEFDTRRKSLMAELSPAMAGIVINEMGLGDVADPEQRSQYFAQRTKEMLAGRFMEGGAKSEEEAMAAAETHFTSLFGSKPEEVTANLDQIYQHTRGVAQRSGGIIPPGAMPGYGGMQSANLMPGGGVPMSPEMGFAALQMMFTPQQSYAMQMQQEFEIARSEFEQYGAPSTYTEEDRKEDLAKYGSSFSDMFSPTQRSYRDPVTGESRTVFLPPSSALNADDSRIRQRMGLGPDENLPGKAAASKSSNPRRPLPRLSTSAADPYVTVGEGETPQEDVKVSPETRAWGGGTTREKTEPKTPAEALTAVQKEMDQLEADHFRSGWFTSKKTWTSPEAQKRYEELRGQKIEITRPMDERRRHAEKYGYDSTTTDAAGKPLPIPTTEELERSSAGKTPEQRFGEEQQAAQIIARHLTPEDEARMRLATTLEDIQTGKSSPLGQRTKLSDEHVTAQFTEVAARELAREQGLDIDQTAPLDVRTSADSDTVTIQGKAVQQRDIQDKIASLMGAAGVDIAQGTVKDAKAMLSPAAARYQEQLQRVEQRKRDLPKPDKKSVKEKAPIIPTDVRAWGGSVGDAPTPAAPPGYKTEWGGWNTPRVIDDAKQSVPLVPGTARPSVSAASAERQTAPTAPTQQVLPPPPPKSAAVVAASQDAVAVAGGSVKVEQSKSADKTAGADRSNDVKINGTLILRGLSEAVIQAAGQRMEATNDGAPVDLGHATQSYT